MTSARMTLALLGALCCGSASAQSAAEVAAKAATAHAQLMKGAAAETAQVATTRARVLEKSQHDDLKRLSSAADRNKQAYLQEMYRQNLPPALQGQTAAPTGEEILFFASKSMQDGDMRGLLEAALADRRIHIVFLGGEAEGGVQALTSWLQKVGRGLPNFPSIQIDPPKFHDFKVTQVPLAVVLRDGKEVARVGGVYSTQWIDTALMTRSGDLGNYGAMTSPCEVDMQQLLESKLANVDWQGFANRAVADFWKDQKLTPVPHASKPAEYEIDPTVTITHDVTLPDGRVLAHAGDRVNPLKATPFKPTLLVIDASDPAQRAFAKAQVAKGDIAQLIVMSTAVPATAIDGWSVWAAWQEEIGTHLYLYSTPYANRFRLSATPSFVSGKGLLLSVRQVVVPDGQETR